MPSLPALTKGERDSYQRAITGSHSRRVEVLVIRRRDDTLLSSFPMPTFLGGGLNGDASRTPMEIAELDVLDDDYTLNWSHGEHRKFRIRVVVSIFVPEMDEWVDDIAFTGPLWDFTREGPVVTLIAQGAERDAMGSVRQVYDKPRKTPATRVIRDLLSAAGARPKDMLIPRLKATLPEAVTVGVRRGKDINPDKKGKQQRKVQRFISNREDTYVGAVSPIADALDRDFFCDNLGRFVMAARKSRPSAKLEAGMLLGPITERRGSDGEQTNTWHVYGRNPKGPRKQVHVKVALPDKHTASAYSLRWNGTRREVIETIRNKKIRNNKAARQVGLRKRDRARREPVEREVSLLPIFTRVRPYMIVSAPSPAGRVSFSVRRWHVPFGPDATPCTLGATRMVKS